MRIGILTFVNTINYGASLQAYALQQVIKEKGHDCKIVDYRSQKIEESHRPQSAAVRRGVKRLFSPIIKHVYRQIDDRVREFEKEYCEFSVPCDKSSIASIAGEYDRIIVGSDQVWNVDITGNDKTYFLDFLEDDKKKYSYAASVGTGYFTTDSVEYESLVKRFQVISVREMETAQRLRESIDREDVVSDVDPTLLNYIKWDRFVTQTNRYGNYMFLYFLPDDPALLDAIRKFAKEKECKLINLTRSIKRRKGIQTVNIASPIDFLNLIAHAQYVITGSFHALCFSLIFHRQFYVTASPKKDWYGRLADLLKLIGRTDRAVLGPDYRFVQRELDYEAIEDKLSRVINASMNTIDRICAEP